jgi:tetratricopeptide (TPR) repeat protein
VRAALDRNSRLDIDAGRPEGRANLANIAEICYRLDGVPLAIELAAAQSDVFAPTAILSLLKASGLPLLEGGNQDQPARLQTMEAAIGWSYALLTDDERALFRSLAVFASGFSLIAAERVADEGPDVRSAAAEARAWHAITSAPSPAIVRTMTALARKNLVVQDTTAPDAPGPRFRVLEPLRLFALDRLRESGKEDQARRRHAAYFAEAAQALDVLTLGPNPEIWFEEQARELDNFRNAQDWALANGESGLVAHLAGYVAQFWLLRGLHEEGRQRIEAAIGVDANVDPADRWFLRFWAAIFAFDNGDVSSASVYASELLEIAEAHGDQLGIGAGLTLLSQIAGSVHEGREEAVSLARKAIDRLEPLGHDVWTASAWARLGIEYQHLGRLEEARDYFERGRVLRRRSHCEGCTPYSLVLLGGVNAELGQLSEAVDAYSECLSLAIKHGNQPLIIRSLLGLADLAWRFGVDQESARSASHFFGAAEAVRFRHGFTWDQAGADHVTRWKHAIRQELGAEAADEAIGQGRALSECILIEHVRQLRVELGTHVGNVRREGPSLIDALGSIE